MIYAQLQMPDTILVQSPPVRCQHYRDLPGRQVDDFSRRVEEIGGRRVKESEIVD